MTRTVLLSSQAQREFRELDSTTRSRVREGLLRFAETGRGDLKNLKGLANGVDLYWLRIGNIRVVVELTGREIRVTRVIPRSAGYDWL